MGVHPYLAYSDPGCVLYNFTASILPAPSVVVYGNMNLLNIINVDASLIVNPNTYIATWYCPPTVVNQNNNKVAVLVHGAMYSHLYWDLPVVPGYSQVKVLRQAGYQVVNMDRLGIGLSDHPPAPVVNCRTSAWIIHQLIGAIKGVTYQPMVNAGKGIPDKVFAIGHSLGSITLSYMVSWFPSDTNGFVCTGWSHTFSRTFAEIVPTLRLAQSDPAFVDRDIPLGYVTTAPNTRGFSFYWIPTTNPTVLALDEQTKETATSGEVVDVFSLTWFFALTRIETPVFQVLGQRDFVVCPPANLLFGPPDCNLPIGPVQLLECNLFPKLCYIPGGFTLLIVPNTGHDLNLHTTNPTYFAAVTDWLNSK